MGCSIVIRFIYPTRNEIYLLQSSRFYRPILGFHNGGFPQQPCCDDRKNQPWQARTSRWSGAFDGRVIYQWWIFQQATFDDTAKRVSKRGYEATKTEIWSQSWDGIRQICRWVKKLGASLIYPNIHLLSKMFKKETYPSKWGDKQQDMDMVWGCMGSSYLEPCNFQSQGPAYLLGS